MSHLWPHPPFAEEQPFSHIILTAHVLTRALTTGSLLGPAFVTPVYALRHFKVIKPSLNPTSLGSIILRSSGTGAAMTMGLMTIAIPFRMWGKEEIEWQDRSWRLLESRGQVEVDKWTYSGMAVGGSWIVLKGKARSRNLLGWRGSLGSIGLGSVGGMLGYMGWRYGVKGGHFEDV